MANKTVQQLLQDGKITNQTNFVKFIQGKTVTINVANHACGKKGTKIRVDTTWLPYYGSPNSYMYMANNSAMLLYMNQITLGEQNLRGLEEIIEEDLKEIELLKSEISLTQQKIAFMKDNSLEEYDDELFKVFEILHALEAKKGTKMEKAMAIAKIIKSS